MGREDDRPLAPQGRHQLAEPDAFLGVQADGRFVDHEQAGLVNQGLRDSQAAPHAAGELLHLAMGDVAQADIVEHGVDAVAPRGAIVETREVGQGVEHLFHAVQPPGAELLRQVAQVGADGAPLLDRVVAEDGHGTGARPEQGADDPHQGALAGAVRAEQTEQARADRQVDPVQGDRAALVDMPKTLHVDSRAHDALLLGCLYGCRRGLVYSCQPVVARRLRYRLPVRRNPIALTRVN